MNRSSTERSLQIELDAPGPSRARFNYAQSLLRPIARACARPGPAIWDLLITVGVLAWPALVIRTWLISTMMQGFRVSDLRGYVSDLGVATLIASVAFVRRPAYRKTLVCLGVVVLSAVALINFEHVRANGASFDIAAAYLLFDSTFASGSILGADTLAKALVVFVPPLGGFLVCERWGRHSGPSVQVLAYGLSLCSFALAEAALPLPSAWVHWRQQHPLVENARRQWQQRVAALTARPSRGPLPPEYKHLHERDLAGESTFAGRPDIRNVLLIMIEGLSRGHIYAVNGPHGGPGWLASLAQFADRHADYTEFLALQRQTNRGEYSVLCGDLPNMVVRDSEMDVYSATPSSERADCLPQFLRRRGWETVYLQAAPITFMGKDEFLPNAGFSSVLDTKWFSKAYATSGWGVDDRAFFEQAGELILQLKRGERPWFLSLLTVGTHHPYLVPPEWKGRSETGSFEDSLLYLDAVLKRFFTLLEEEHILDDTLVLITGDESAGYIEKNETAELLSQHSVPLIAAYPGDRHVRVGQRFTHSDLALSVADALQLGDAAPFHGRSVFRHYAEGRRLLFGNTYTSKLGAVGPRGELLICETTAESCSGFRIGNEGMFQGALESREVADGEALSLKQAVAALDREVPAASDRRVSLLNRGAIRLHPKDDEQLIFYGKYHDTARPARASVQLAFSVDDGSAILHHDITSDGGTQVMFDTPQLRLLPGTSIVWNYDLAASVPLTQLEFRMSAFNRSLSEVVLKVEEASVEIRDLPPAEPQAPAQDTVQLLPQRFTVTLAAEARLNLLEHRGFLDRASCATDGAQGSWSIRGCADGAAVFGPYMPLPAGATVSVAFEMAVQSGTATSYVEITADGGRTVLGRSAPEALLPGARKLSTSVQLARQYADVETRLQVSGAASLSASLQNVWLDIKP